MIVRLVSLGAIYAFLSTAYAVVPTLTGWHQIIVCFVLVVFAIRALVSLVQGTVFE